MGYGCGNQEEIDEKVLTIETEVKIEGPRSLAFTNFQDPSMSEYFRPFNKTFFQNHCTIQ